MQAPRLTAPCTAQRGLTLIELMISLTIGLFIMAAASAIFVTSARTSKVSAVNTQLNEDGVLALAVVTQQIRQAGYSRRIQSGAPSGVNTNFHGAAVRGCSGGFSDESVTGQFAAAQCKITNAADARTANADALIVRYEATAGNTFPDTNGAPTNCVGNSIAAVAVSAAPSIAPGSPANPAYALADNRFTLDPTAGSAPPTHTLRCAGMEANQTATGNAQPLIENVEQLTLRYGVASRAELEAPAIFAREKHQIIAYLNAAEVDALPLSDDVPANANAQAQINDRWGRVRSVKICMVLRSDQPLRDAGAIADYTDCHNATHAVADGYPRRSFSTTVALRNRLPVPMCRSRESGTPGTPSYNIAVPEECPLS